ncbi:NAF1-domain-containing protein [Melanogaster broomeanus]|nr:NAF1-domain-containing protein [Melanogaster broomeanus]
MNVEFKVPSTIPQDLLLIQDLIGDPDSFTVIPNRIPDPPSSSDDSIDSTDNEVGSEDEVEAGLLPAEEENVIVSPTVASGSASDSDSDTSSISGSEDDLVHEAPSTSHPQKPIHDSDDEESGVAAATAYQRTKNEVFEADIITPTISEVEPEDRMEKVGERALDVESLLVFEDRKVLGYIYETFGPTSQPLYQVKFTQQHPLDTAKIWLSREVFHVPQRSRFVFVDQLKKLRGSDASNLHDEEPADDEVEFSDDEQEAAFKAQRKKRRGQSVSSSRRSTPAPSWAHADDMVDDTFHGSNPYDAHGPYDDDYHVAGPSRPPPVPYDDPYAEPANLDVHLPRAGSDAGTNGERFRGRGYGRQSSRSSRDRGSGRGARGRGDRNRQPARRDHRSNSIASQETFHSSTFSPTSPAMERGTEFGQFPDSSSGYSVARPASNSWDYQQQSTMQGQNYQVQPHINPRFASAFGFSLPAAHGPWVAPQTMAYSMSQPQQNWVDQWTVHDTSGTDGDEHVHTQM